MTDYESYLSEPSRFDSTQNIPSVYEVVSGIIGGNSTQKFTKTPLNYEINDRTGLLIMVYFKTFYNLSAKDIRKRFTQDITEFIKQDEPDYFTLPERTSVISCTEISTLVQNIPQAIFNDIPSLIKMPVTQLLHSNIPISPQIPKNASHGYKSDRNEFESDKFDISSANSDGLSCLASNSFIRHIFHEDLRSVTARKLIKTSSPVPSSSIGLTSELVNTITQLMVE